MTTGMDERLYRAASGAVDKWVELHADETFSLDDICRHLEIHEADKRSAISRKLAYEVKQGRLDKHNKIYHLVNNNTKYLDWVNSDLTTPLDIRWPYSLEDETRFGFDGCIEIAPRDIIVVAGVSNTGKSCFAKNFLWENMDTYPCTLMGNEYSAYKFRKDADRMTWRNPLNENGTAKFELIERHDQWKDIIRPDSINIIDWINLDDNFYRIGSILEGMQQKLNKGILMAILQKDPSKEMGMGGQWGMHLSNLYLTLDFGKLFVKKAKTWTSKNPNFKSYGFEIIEHGTRFHNIREVKNCPKCWGKSATGHYKCEMCSGKGYVDVKGNVL